LSSFGEWATPQYFTVSAANDFTCAFGANFTIEKNTLFAYIFASAFFNEVFRQAGT